MKTGFDLLRNSALAMLFALGTVGLSACGDEGGDAPVPSEPASMEEPAGSDSMMDDAKEKAGEMMDEAGEAVDEAGAAMEDAAGDAMDSMEGAAEDASDAMKDSMDETKDKMMNP